MNPRATPGSPWDAPVGREAISRQGKRASPPGGFRCDANREGSCHSLAPRGVVWIEKAPPRTASGRSVGRTVDSALLIAAGQRAVADYARDYRRENELNGIYVSPDVIGGGHHEDFPRWDHRLLTEVAEAMDAAPADGSRVECAGRSVPCELEGDARVVFSFGPPEMDGDTANLLVHRMVQVDHPRAEGAYADQYRYRLLREDGGWRVVRVTLLRMH